MSKEKSSIPGGYRITEHVKDSSFFGNDRSYTQTHDYTSGGSWVSGTKTDHNGDQWSTSHGGTTQELIGNDGRNK